MSCRANARLISRKLLPNPQPGESCWKNSSSQWGFRRRRSRAIGVPPQRINEIVLGKGKGTADTELRLTRYFGVSDGFFLQLQTDHDLMARPRQIGEKLKGSSRDGRRNG